MKKAVLVLTTLAVSATAVLVATTGNAAPKVAFGVPRIVDPIHLYGEPNIKVAPHNGDVHVSGPQGTGVQRSIWNISTDNGDSYRLVQEVPNEDLYASSLQPTKASYGPGGGDTEIAIARNGKVFYNDLWALMCFTAATTSDSGKTIKSNPKGCSNPGGDRQWFGIFDPKPSDKTISPYKGPLPLNYHEYNALVTNRVETSTDGLNYDHLAGEYNQVDSGYSNTQAPIVVDQHTGDVLSLAQGTSNSLYLVVGEPTNAAGDLKFRYNPVTGPLPGNPGTLFPVLVQDTARNLYAVWVDNKTYQAYYSWAPPTADGKDWKKWSAPKQVSKAPSRTNLMPWAVAGGPGILDVVWYGTDKSLADLGPDGPSAKKNQIWHVYFSQITKANSSKPKMEQVQATPHPMHYGDICMLGTACISAGGNRNIADFFQVTLDNQGRARIVYNDTSNQLSQSTMDSAADHSGAALVSTLTQSTGVNGWTGKPLPKGESNAPTNGVKDRPGDALWKPLGGEKVTAGDIHELKMRMTDAGLSIEVRTKGGPLADAAVAGASPFAQLIVRWQMGNKLYHAGAEQSADGETSRFFAGETRPVDLCSVSGCKPNYFDYFGAPNSATGEVTSAGAGGPTTYKINVPKAAVGNPTPSNLLESVMGFVTVSPYSNSTPLTNERAFVDVVPVMIEGTKTFNFRGSAKGSSGAVLPVGLFGMVLAGTATKLRRG